MKTFLAFSEPLKTTHTFTTRSDLMSDDITAALRCAEAVRRDTEGFRGRGNGYTAW